MGGCIPYGVPLSFPVKCRHGVGNLAIGEPDAETQHLRRSIYKRVECRHDADFVIGMVPKRNASTDSNSPVFPYLQKNIFDGVLAMKNIRQDSDSRLSEKPSYRVCREISARRRVSRLWGCTRRWDLYRGAVRLPS